MASNKPHVWIRERESARRAAKMLIDDSKKPLSKAFTRKPYYLAVKEEKCRT